MASVGTLGRLSARDLSKELLALDPSIPGSLEKIAIIDVRDDGIVFLPPYLLAQCPYKCFLLTPPTIFRPRRWPHNPLNPRSQQHTRSCHPIPRPKISRQGDCRFPLRAQSGARSESRIEVPKRERSVAGSVGVFGRRGGVDEKCRRE